MKRVGQTWAGAGAMRFAGRTSWLTWCALAIAGASLSAIPARASERSQALYARGLVPFNSGQWEQAYRLFDQAVQADRTDAMAVYYRGLAQARRGAATAAIADLEQALQLNPELPHAALDLGIAQFDAGQYVVAKTWLGRAHEQGFERFTAALFLGMTLYRLGEDAAALSFLNEAQADPDLRPTARYYEGLTLLRQGKKAAAQAAFAEVAREKPQSDIGQTAQRYATGTAPAPAAVTRAVTAKPLSLFAQLGFEYDTNVVAGPSESSVKGLPGISGEGDGRTVVAAGGDYQLLEGDFGTLRAEYDFYQSIHFKLTEFDLQGHRVRADFASEPKLVSYGLSGIYNFYALDYQSFYQEGLAIPWVALAEGQDAATQLYYRVRGRDFMREPFNPGGDALNHALGARQFIALGRTDRMLSAGYQFDAEDTISSGPMGRDFQYKGHQIDAALSFPILSIARGDVGYLFRLEDYQFPNSRTGFGFRRHDSQHQFALAVAHDLTPHVALIADYVGVINTSNIAEFDYDRNIVSAGIRVTF